MTQATNEAKELNEALSMTALEVLGINSLGWVPYLFVTVLPALILWMLWGALKDLNAIFIFSNHHCFKKVGLRV